jgi:hypothetical protein
MMTPKQKIYRYLQTAKTHSSTMAIAVGTGLDPLQAEEILREEAQKGFIALDDEGLWYLPIKLTPLILQMREHPTWTYTPPAMVTAEPLPEEYDGVNPDDICQAIQDQRGTCTGHGFRQAADTYAVVLAGELPTEEDRAKYRAFVTLPNGMLVCILWPISHSAEGFYEKGRKIGNIPPWLEGGYIWACAQAWVDWGTCYEDQWPTALTPNAVQIDEPAGCSVEAARHRAEGYAQTTILDDVKRAIMKYKGIPGAILVYDNYRDALKANGGDGWFPLPPKGGGVAGGHCLFFYGWNKRGLKCLHSWDPALIERKGGVPWEYLSHTDLNGPANQGFTVILDSVDTRRIRQEYVTLIPKTPLRANIYLMDGIEKKFLGVYDPAAPVELKGAYAIGTPVTFYAEAIDYYDVNNSVTVIPDASMRDVMIDLTVPAPKTFWERILEWIRNLFGK